MKVSFWEEGKGGGRKKRSMNGLGMLGVGEGGRGGKVGVGNGI